MKNTQLPSFIYPFYIPPIIARFSATLPSHLTLARLQSIGEELVELGHLAGDGKVDGAVGNLNDETADDLRVDLCTSLAFSASPVTQAEY